MTDKQLDSVLQESRTFAPSSAFREGSHVPSMEDYKKRYEESLKDPEGFWAGVAEDLFWYKKWDQVLDSSGAPFYKWFVGAKTNLSYNCLDRHLDSDIAKKPAIVWEGEPGDKKTLTYEELWRETNIFANVLRKMGIKKGDRIALYLPMIPELAIAMLACARIGAVHSVIFAGFSADSIKDRVLDSETKMVITRPTAAGAAARCWR